MGTENNSLLYPDILYTCIMSCVQVITLDIAEIDSKCITYMYMNVLVLDKFLKLINP